MYASFIRSSQPTIACLIQLLQLIYIRLFNIQFNTQAFVLCQKTVSFSSFYFQKHQNGHLWYSFTLSPKSNKPIHRDFVLHICQRRVIVLTCGKVINIDTVSGLVCVRACRYCRFLYRMYRLFTYMSRSKQTCEPLDN